MAGFAGFGLAGLLIGRLTLQLNSHLYERAADVVALLLYFVGGYGLVGAALGVGAGLALRLIRTTSAPGRLQRALTVAALSGLLLGPILYYLLLPDVGVGHGLLSGILFGASRARLLLTLVGFAAGLTLAGVLGARIVDRIGAATGRSSRGVLTGAWGLAAVAAIIASVAFRPAGQDAGSLPRIEVPPPAPENAEPPLVLLCIDGCDLDDVVAPMVEAGELPTFARLMRQGAWGPLKTLEPTLSAVVWTTIATGKTPDQHGIRHFIVFRLPGVQRAIYQFPRHTGLNFRVFPRLERIPGMPALQAPYTSNMRRAEALWGIIGRYYPVGVYRWLVTWPVEAVNGFNVAGGVGWIQIMSAFESSAGDALKRGFHHPVDVYDGLEEPPVLADVTREMLNPYIGETFDVDMQDGHIKAMAAALRDPTGHYLPRLIRKFETRFTAANFYNVDEFCHHFATYKDKGGVFSNAVAERYRFTDARLGEFLETVGDSVNVVVVSDHGYNFVQNHHTDAPDGVFFGIGPAFRAGARVDDLGVYDIAPLCLKLLNLPLPDDMPGSSRFRNGVELPFLTGAPEPAAIVTWETGERRDATPLESPVDDLIKEQLRSLGYIN